MGSNTSLRLHLQQIYNASITIQTQITAFTATITMTEPSALLALLVKSFIAFPESLVGVVTPGTTGTGDGASVCMIASISIWKAVISWKYDASILSSELVGLTALYASPSMYAVFFFRISVWTFSANDCEATSPPASEPRTCPVTTNDPVSISWFCTTMS